MALLNLFKLEKLRIEAYKDEDRGQADLVDRMEVMFNPATYQEKHANAFRSARYQAINSPGRAAFYGYTPPSDLSFQLVFDGTGVSELGAVHLLAGASVKDDIARFKKLCLEMDGGIHEPFFLMLFWGRGDGFPCRLASLDVTYKLIDRSGAPLRAELAARFVRDESEDMIARRVGKNSPDLTHVRVVKAGDTLPLLCKEIYGSPVHYLRVAADNGLDDFRNLVPGQKLRFAPLA
jgi:hypothetical protein